MTQTDFFPYAGVHIRFKLSTGKELSGVLFQRLNVNQNEKPDTMYRYIPTINMIAWKQAEQRQDQSRMESLESEIDIQNIVWAERIKY